MKTNISLSESTVISDASSTGVQKSEMYFKWILFHVAR